MLTILADSWQWLVALVGVLVAGFAVRKTAIVKTQAAADVMAAKKETVQAQRRVETVKAANDAKKDVSSADSSSVDKQLLDDWTRDD